MRPFNRQERYQRLEQQRHGILDQFRVEQSQGICSMDPIVAMNAWLKEIMSFLGQARYQRAIGAGLPPTSPYITHQEAAHYVQVVGNELERIKR